MINFVQLIPLLAICPMAFARTVPRYTWLAAFVSLVFLLAISRPALAADACTREPNVDIRYNEILTVFERGQTASRWWWYGWTGGYAAATLSQGILAVATTDRGTRIDSIVGGAESAIGVIGMLVATPRTPIWAAGDLREMDDRTPCARLRRLRRAEKLLKDSADEQESAISWYAQVIGAGLNLAGATVLWVGYQRYATGWYTLGFGVATQEAQILTQPTGALRAWNAYSVHRQVTWSVTPFPGGAGVSGVF